MPDRSLDSLSREFYPRVCEALARITGRGVAVVIVQTSRTIEEHQANLANGTSGAALSLHLPRYLRWSKPGFQLTDKDGCDAIDIALYEQYQLHGPDKVNWDATDPAWGIIGEEYERAGLRWGGRWITPFDPGHGELILPWTASAVVVERARPWPTFRKTV